ncbi:MAG: FAD-dependent oxidoreductase, partial [Caldilineaceae bacterium]|nr:FAD-dependent oxidoreductase [Caldilineaceae bacterium]
GHPVTIVDKGRTVGGRLATREMGPGHADHGAQFFTVRDATFREHVAQWETNGLVYVWGTGWSDGSLVDSPQDGYPRYAVRGGMNALAQHLAGRLIDAGAAIHVNRTITSVTQGASQWQADDDTGACYRGDALILTPPVPQSLALLDAGCVGLNSTDRSALERITYAPCLCGIFWLEGEIALPEPGAIQRPGTDISWVADNRAKGISPDTTLITVHAGPEYSRRHYTAPDDELLATFQASLQPFCSGRIKRHDAELKRWRYALPTVLHPARFLEADSALPLFFGGDAFGHPRVEGAALSGLRMGEAMVALLG